MAELTRVDKDGNAPLEHLRRVAEKGDPVALARLSDIPDYPEEIEYLIYWSQELLGRSGASMIGLLPLSPTVLKDWARLTDRWPLHPLEVEALLLFDAARLAPEEEPAKGEPSILRERQKPRPRWPQKKD